MASSDEQREAWDGVRLQLSHLDLPAAVMDREGAFRGASPRGRALLERFGAELTDGQGPVPESLLAVLDRAANGEAVVWNPGGVPEEASLGCARHPLGGAYDLLVMRELTHKNRELARRLHQQRLEVTGRLVASIVHDLRAPLASIIFSGEVLTERITKLDPSDVAEIVGDIVQSARRLRQIVDGLLGFARLETAEENLCFMDEVLDRVSGLVRPVLREEGHVLRTYVGPGARQVLGSGLMVEQILVNLILNAAESSREPLSVKVSANRDPNDGSMVRITVVDDGPGIAADVRPHIFQPFFTTKHTGTGLGLTAARESAREQGGDLVLDPTAGRGTSFSLYLRGAREGAE